ncbi:hypothetical protein RHMOL_Rhmol09G0025900 [Rhododendron molle]|uniref:Uncharacterized protein n=1 Tax=Rhododendron molle TaxID=49168 RepID=A0ACC0MA87_RHOML|nr:hypothetical protein RHMOL_Rhmol09G0025900 [Rhododendron molle]
MAGGNVYNDFSALEEDFDVFEANVLNKYCPVSEEIPCPECETMLMSLEEVVAHCVEVHDWGGRNKSTMGKLMLNDVSDPRTMSKGLIEEESKGLLEEEYKGQKSEAGTYNTAKPKAEVSWEWEKWSLREIT